MNMPVNQNDKQALFEKRQQLFSIWRGQEQAPESPVPPAPRPQLQASKAQPDEVRELIQKFSNPNADRMSLL